ncbi:hypothetical protein LZD49_33000 [Dyadobacter sp. CY261]|uniref:hypothetical protein n=1 Tax=Dyadobacter sp. CY261 TaxID=2907203 RepID=UPI001F296E68|nr:hypothetical protein [Dyadobacter sp. CY261]MCF0075343.1 hypothetical protein [Dyadobacter sp. CY261]
MDKETLVDLFDRRDKKRRRLLYRLYQELIHSDLTAAYIAEKISWELEREGLISSTDIKFCRYHFKKRPLKKLPHSSGSTPPTNRAKDRKMETASSTGLDGTWTDPEKISLIDNMIVESKFAKKKNHET